jgi:hypothetical protein
LSTAILCNILSSLIIAKYQNCGQWQWIPVLPCLVE